MANLTDELGNTLTDELGNALTDAGSVGVVASVGAYVLSGLAIILTKAIAIAPIVHFRYRKS